jgi:hypothetical protein
MVNAGLEFQVGYLHMLLVEGRHGDSVGARTPVFFAAVLAYLTVEFLEPTGNVADDEGKGSRRPVHH